MARYIDADKLIAHLKDEIKACEPKFGGRANGKSVAYGTELGLKSAISFAETLATADVSPKSEVDKAYARGFERGKKANVCGFSAEEIAQKAENLAIELDAMRGAANSYKMHYENERQEVARAICCEIEKEIVAALESNYRALKEWDDGRCNDYILEMVNRVKGKIDALRGIEGFVEELKKKYTEGKYEN